MNSLITGEGITLTEALSAGGMTTIIGLLIVFSVLAILMLILYLFKFIFYKKPTDVKAPSDEKVSEANTMSNSVTADTAISAAPVNSDDTEDEDELIAVLTAAVAASLKTSTYNLKIKSYRRIQDKRPAWNKEGLRETIGNRF